ncbi:MAG: hypothetical protein QXL88_00910 [Candidatus Pacearchaeota archaeon]
MCKISRTLTLVVGHILLIVGIWLFSKGLILNPNKPVLLHPIFLGLIVLFAGICAIKCKCEKEK